MPETLMMMFLLLLLGALARFASATANSQQTYDYVVVGGGTAGLAIASRLSQHYSVAVIEAGGDYRVDNGNLSTVPGLALSIPFLDTTPAYPRNSLMDWDYITVPQTEAGNRAIHYAQGKTLGGSSAINTMAYHRATQGTYQKWADLVDDQSYTYANFVQYFKKQAFLSPPNFAKRNTPNATFEYDASAFDNLLRGPVQASWAQWVDPTITWLAQALRSIGLSQNNVGLNSGQLLGSSAFITTTVDPRDATRSSSRTSYLDQVGTPAGLKVFDHARVERILFLNKRAFGVAATCTRPFILTARKEVILSAGVIGSPHLLQVSGVGPAEELRKYGIPVIADLPGVGQNLWDQLLLTVINAVTTPSGPEQITRNPAQAQSEYTRQYGPLSSISAYVSFEKIPGYLRDTFSEATKAALGWFSEDWPEVEYVAGSAAGPNGGSLGVLSICLVAPLSRGSISIESSNSSVPPRIDLGWLTNPADQEVAVASIKRARQAWKNISSIISGPEITPGAAVQTDAQILEYIRNSVTPIWHAGATCAMGRGSDEAAVVDSKARVFGVKGLRIVDASVFPFMVPGHPQSTVYALAEKIADVIIKG